MTAEALAKALNGIRTGGSWMVRCPAHDDSQPSLSVTNAADGKVLVCCHAGCAQRDVVAALRSRGLWEEAGQGGAPQFASMTARSFVQAQVRNEKRTEAALRIWPASRSAEGTLVEDYLRSRSIQLPPPAAVRFHPALKHPAGGVWPAMVALVTRGTDGTPIAVHRTFLNRDGNGKAPVVPSRMMLGPCRGGAVRLAEPGAVLMLGEGIETCLAAMQATGNPAWAALSTSGLRALELPVDVVDIVVLADADAAGEAAAQDSARRWKSEGRRVRIARPPVGLDFNDLIESQARSIVECAS